MIQRITRTVTKPTSRIGIRCRTSPNSITFILGIRNVSFIFSPWWWILMWSTQKHLRERVGKLRETAADTIMDYLSFSSSDVDEDAVEELLSQILDEEVLRITTIPAGKQGPLDPELEARYEKLKAFVVSNPRPHNFETITKHPESCSKRRNLESPPGSNPSSSSEENKSFSSTTLQEGDSNSSPREREQSGRSRSSARTFMASPSRRSISPPPPRSCFCGSPKKLLRSLSSRKSQRKSAMSETGSDSSRFATKKSIAMKDDGIEVISKVKGGNLQDELDALSDEEFLTDLSTFSLKSQQKKLKKALSEEEKVNREAEELVKWVKQASARMDVSISDESLSDEDELKR